MADYRIDFICNSWGTVHVEAGSGDEARQKSAEGEWKLATLKREHDGHDSFSLLTAGQIDELCTRINTWPQEEW